MLSWMALLRPKTLTTRNIFQEHSMVGKKGFTQHHCISLLLVPSPWVSKKTNAVCHAAQRLRTCGATGGRCQIWRCFGVFSGHHCRQYPPANTAAPLAWSMYLSWRTSPSAKEHPMPSWVVQVFEKEKHANKYKLRYNYNMKNITRWSGGFYVLGGYKRWNRYIWAPTEHFASALTWRGLHSTPPPDKNWKHNERKIRNTSFCVTFLLVEIETNISIIRGFN